jgi:phage replication-related protein YjqB (UPF0714/DUF867 family)
MAEKDMYSGYAEMASQEWGEFRLSLLNRDSPVLILALHGGGIEPGTSEIASAIAGSEFSLYCFESLKGDGDRSLHLTSFRFDEPECVRMVTAAHTVLSVHGCEGDHGRVFVGGRNGELRNLLIRTLQTAGFQAVEDNSHHAGVSPKNICNRGRTGRGVQLEIEIGLRREMFAGLREPQRRWRTSVFARFVEAVRSTLLDGDMPPPPSGLA